MFEFEFWGLGSPFACSVIGLFYLAWNVNWPLNLLWNVIETGSVKRDWGVYFSVKCDLPSKFNVKRDWRSIFYEILWQTFCYKDWLKYGHGHKDAKGSVILTCWNLGLCIVMICFSMKEYINVHVFLDIADHLLKFHESTM